MYVPPVHHAGDLLGILYLLSATTTYLEVRGLLLTSFPAALSCAAIEVGSADSTSEDIKDLFGVHPVVEEERLSKELIFFLSRPLGVLDPGSSTVSSVTVCPLLSTILSSQYF